MGGDVTARYVIIIPALNERWSIPGVLADIRRDAPDAPVWVVDGGSTDGTPEYVDTLMQDDPALALLRNPEGHQSFAVNMAARLADSRGIGLFFRLDAHARYPEGYIQGLLRCMADQGADNVVVPLIATGSVGWRGANAALQKSWLGHGGAAHRRAARRGWVVHGHHALFRTSRFLELGGYDTRLAANEDAEFDTRLLRAGGCIFLENRWPVQYAPRAGLWAVARQMFRNGVGRAQNLRKHRSLPKLRQLLPVLALLATVSSLILAPVLPAMAVPGLTYAGLVALISVSAAFRHRANPIRIFLLALATHLAFGAGLLWEKRPESFPVFPTRRAEI